MALAALALTLAACEPNAILPSGPASLQLVPPSYYSTRAPRPGPGRSQSTPRERSTPQPRDTQPPIAEPALLDAAPDLEIIQELQDAKRTLEQMNLQLQQLRRSIARPTKPPPTNTE